VKAAAFSLWIFAAFLAFQVQTPLRSADFFSGNADQPLYRLLGGAEEAAGDVLFLKADSYFHGGVIEKFEEPEGSVKMEGLIEEKDEKKEKPEDWIARVNDQVRSSEHRHLSGKERIEMLPFFALSTKLDPYNVEAVLTSSYWLDSEFHKAREAQETLEKGIRDNPGSWEIENALAGLYDRARDFAQSERHYLAAIEKSKAGPIETYWRTWLYYHLAESRLAQGKPGQALESYREAIRFFDAKSPTALKGKIEDKIRQLSGA
jgi:tetratricopeptide (TPR) repeat protein